MIWSSLYLSSAHSTSKGTLMIQKLWRNSLSRQHLQASSSVIEYGSFSKALCTMMVIVTSTKSKIFALYFRSRSVLKAMKKVCLEIDEKLYLANSKDLLALILELSLVDFYPRFHLDRSLIKYHHNNLANMN